MNMNNKYDQELHTTLERLERLVREAGDQEIGDQLRKVLESPDRINSLHEVFVKKLRKNKGHDTSSSRRREFFSEFSSHNGDRLSEVQVDRLVSLTRRWELSEDSLKALKVCSLLWTAKPCLFWHGKTPEGNLFLRSFDDLERMREVDPARRKGLLVILSRQIVAEQGKCHRANAIVKKRERTRPTKGRRTGFTIRNPLLLTSSLRALCQRFWPNISKSAHNERKKRISAYSLWGWKWDQLNYVEMILSLSQAPTKPFEVYNWHKTEFEAINGYLETLPQFSIRDFLLQSWESIESYYYDEKYPNFGVRRSSAPYQESITSIDNESSQHSHISTVNFGTCNEKETDKAPENVATNWKSRQREGSQQNRHLAQPGEYLPQRVLSHSHLIFPETTAQTAEMRSLNGHQQSDSLEISSANAPNCVLADQEHDNPTMELEKNTVDGMLRSQQPDHALLPVNSHMLPHNIFNAAQLGLPMSLENLDFSQDTFDSQQPGHALLPVNSDMIPNNIFNAAQLGLPMSLENLDFSQDTFDSQQPGHALLPVNSDMIPRNIFNAAQLGLPMSLENSHFSQDTSSLLAQFVAQNMNDL